MARASGTVLYTVLDMGLGHASRSLPLIREFDRRGWETVIGSSGRALLFLRREIAHARFVQLPGYDLEYTARGADPLRLLGATPRLLGVVNRTRRIVEEITREEDADLVVSDHRYGGYSDSVPSVFLSHQIRLLTPPALRPTEALGAGVHRFVHSRFRHVLVPDEAHGAEGLLSGRLSRVRNTGSRYIFSGILSSVNRREGVERDIDVLFSISGPEPQRSILEVKLRARLDQVPGRKVMVLGRPESRRVETPADDLTIYAHPDRQEMEDLMNRARLIVSRPGYSTLMELAELGTPALLIPTPGQTEQLYLAARMRRMGWLHAVEQDAIDLPGDLERAAALPGIPGDFSTARTVERIFTLFEQTL